MAGHRSALDVDNVDLAAVLLVEALGQSDLALMLLVSRVWSHRWNLPKLSVVSVEQNLRVRPCNC